MYLSACFLFFSILPIALVVRYPVMTRFEFSVIPLLASLFSLLIFASVLIMTFPLACTMNPSQSSLNIDILRRKIRYFVFSAVLRLENCVLVPLVLPSVPKFPPEILHGRPDVFSLRKGKEKSLQILRNRSASYSV